MGLVQQWRPAQLSCDVNIVGHVEAPYCHPVLTLIPLEQTAGSIPVLNLRGWVKCIDLVVGKHWELQAGDSPEATPTTPNSSSNDPLRPFSLKQ